MRNQRRLGVEIFACLVLVFGFAAKSEGKRIRMAIPAHNMAQIAFYVAKDKGYYMEEGLDVDLVQVRGPVANMALVAKEVEFTSVPTAGLTAAMRGTPLRIVYTTYHRPMWWLYAKPDIQKIEDLRGRKVGVSSMGSLTSALAKQVLTKHGLREGRDVAVLPVGTQPGLFAAFESGLVDAGMITVPWNFRSIEAGFRELVSFTREGYIFLTGTLVTRDELLQSEPRMVEGFLRATIKGQMYARSNRAEVIRIAVKNIKVTDDLAARAYDVARLAMTDDGSVGKNDQRTYFAMVAEIRGIKDPPAFEKFFDFSMVGKISAELKASGWAPKP